MALFIGKKGDGKRSSINALFNVIKGINKEDNYRFILIEESKEENNLENGLHLYYIKDIKNNPIIIINCIGFGDIRGKEYDEEINNAFIYIFSNLIYHINLICFIGKETNEKLNIFNRYIFNCATSLFTEDVIENFIILVTHPNKYIIKEEWSNFIGSLSDDINFDDIKNKLGNKWKYFIDNQSIFDDKINELTVYSFEKLNEIYKVKLLGAKKKTTEKFPQFIKYRYEIINYVKNIISIFKNLKLENNKIPNFDRQINEYENKIKNINNKIDSANSSIRCYNSNIDYYNGLINELDLSHNKTMAYLDDQYETVKTRVLESCSFEYTYCNECKNNCHEYCDCIGSFVNRCEVFPIFGDTCQKCWHSKSKHN